MVKGTALILFVIMVFMGTHLPCLFASPLLYEDVDRMIKEKEFDAAESSLKAYLSSNGKDAAALAMLGRLYQEMGDRKKSNYFLSKAIKIDPDYPPAHFFLGKNYYMELKNDAAVSEFAVFQEKMSRLSRLGHEEVLFYINALEKIGEIYFSLKMYEEFYAVDQKILKIVPDDQTALYNIGVYHYIYSHSNSKAYQFFNKVIVLSPDSYLAKKARYAIEFMRANPDSRMAPDFDFIDKL